MPLLPCLTPRVDRGRSSSQVRDLLSIDDEHVDRRLECFLGVPPAPGTTTGTGLLPSMYDQRYRYMRWVYSCSFGIVKLALELPAVAQYIRDMAPMDPDEAHYTDWIFRFLHRQLEEAEQTHQAAISVPEAEAIIATFKQFEIATCVGASVTGTNGPRNRGQFFSPQVAGDDST